MPLYDGLKTGVMLGPSFGANHHVIPKPVLASEREERLQVENVVAPPCQQGGLPTSKEAVVCLPASKEGIKATPSTNCTHSLYGAKKGAILWPSFAANHCAITGRERYCTSLPARMSSCHQGSGGGPPCQQGRLPASKDTWWRRPASKGARSGLPASNEAG